MADALGMQLQGGFLQAIPGTSSNEQIIQVVNDIINTLNNQLQSSTSSDGTSKRYLNGFQQGGWPGGSFGMKISKPGVDVTTASYAQLLFYWDYTTNIQYYNDPSTNKTYTTIGSSGIKVAKSGIDVTTATNDQLIFNSAQNVFKIVSKGTQAFSYSNIVPSLNIITVPHGLSYAPLISGSISYTVAGGSGVAILPWFYPQISTTITISILASIEVDTTNIYFRITNNTPVSGTFTYYIQQETAS